MSLISKLLPVLTVLILSVASAFSQSGNNGGIKTTNSPFSGAILSTDGTRFFWTTPTNLTASATNAQPPSTVLTNLSNTSALTNEFQLNSLVSKFTWDGAGPNTNAPGVIIDMDYGGDVDDAFDLSLAVALHRLGLIKILAVTHSSSNDWAAASISAALGYYGVSVPVGISKVPTGLTTDVYGSYVATNYANPSKFYFSNALDAVSVMRYALKNAKDSNVLFITTGPLNNIQRLIDSTGDSISPYTGTQLLSQKLRPDFGMIVVACYFTNASGVPNSPEFNVLAHINALNWVNTYAPNSFPVTWFGDEVYGAVQTGAGYSTNLSAFDPAFNAFRLAGVASRPAWAQGAFLLAGLGTNFTYGSARGSNVFGFSSGGTNQIVSGGSNIWWSGAYVGQKYATNLANTNWLAGIINSLVMPSAKNSKDYLTRSGDDVKTGGQLSFTNGASVSIGNNPNAFQSALYVQNSASSGGFASGALTLQDYLGLSASHFYFGFHEDNYISGGRGLNPDNGYNFFQTRLGDNNNVLGNGANTNVLNGVTIQSNVTPSRVLRVDANNRITNVFSSDPANEYVHADGSVGTPSGSGGGGAGSLPHNLNQFDTNSAVSIKDGALLTNMSVRTALTLPTLTASRAATINSSGQLTNSVVTDTEQGYLSGVTSALQTQLNSKQQGSFILTNFVLMGISNIVSANANTVITTNAGVLTITTASGSSGGTNFPAVLNLLGSTNISATSGNEQAFTISTNASFALNFQGTPNNGQIFKVGVSNPSASIIRMTNYQNGSLASFFNPSVGSNDTTIAIPASSIRWMEFLAETNFNLGVVRWNLTMNEGPQLELGFTNGIAGATNGGLLTLSVVSAGLSGDIQFNETGSLAGTNRFNWDRTNSSLKISGNAVDTTLHVTNTVGIGTKLSTLGVGSETGSDFSLISSNATLITLTTAGDLVPSSSNRTDYGSLLLPIKNVYADSIYARSSGNSAGGFTVIPTLRTNFADGNITFPLATHVAANWTNAVAGNRTITITRPVPGMSFRLSLVSDGSARTLSLFNVAGGTCTWLSTNDTANATNVLTTAGKRSLICGTVDLGTDGNTTNLTLWVKNQTP